jgi:hypothetical protein
MTKSAFPQTNVFSGLKNDWVKLSELFPTLNFIIFNGGKRCGKLDFVIFDGGKVWKIDFAKI